MIDYTFVPAKTFDEGIKNLYTLVVMLRSPQGCPWDREQMPADIARALLDETYEYMDDLRSGNVNGCAEELGDMLLNAFMIVHMHEQAMDFEPVAPLNAICEKLVRRHPHVFSSAQVANSTEVLGLWNSIKETVEGKKTADDDVFSRIPASLPQLEEAWEIQKHMRKVGFDWPDIGGVVEKVHEELEELEQAIAEEPRDIAHIEEELGDVLFAVVNLARYLKLSPSVALHRSNKKVRQRFNRLAALARQEHIALDAEHVDQLNGLWDRIKIGERRSNV